MCLNICDQHVTQERYYFSADSGENEAKSDEVTSLRTHNWDAVGRISLPQCVLNTHYGLGKRGGAVTFPMLWGGVWVPSRIPLLKLYPPPVPFPSSLPLSVMLFREGALRK